VSCKLVAEVAEELLEELLDELLDVPAVLGALAFPACNGALTLGVNP
jgi:hypothetical protein